MDAEAALVRQPEPELGMSGGAGARKLQQSDILLPDHLFKRRQLWNLCLAVLIPRHRYSPAARHGYITGTPLATPNSTLS